MSRKIESLLVKICCNTYVNNVVEKVLNKHGIEYQVFDEEKIFDTRYSAMLLVGTDRDLLVTLQEIKNPPPILHINPPGYRGFFASLDWSDFEKGFSRIIRGEYVYEEFMRLKAVVDQDEPIYGLNELALFSSRSAVLVNYALYIDDELIWRDISDGVIIATPTGSTAYAFSAGGPIVMRDVEAFVVVPVNSLNPIRRSLVVPASSHIVLSDITSGYRCEAVVDGVVRRRVRREVVITRAEKPVVFIKLVRKISEPIKKKESLAVEDSDLPPSAKYVFKMLELHGEATIKELVEITGLPERTVRYALTLLIRKGLVERVFSLRDTRRRIYRVKIRE